MPSAPPSLLLIAGRGSRLGRPHAKCLSRLAGRRLIDWQRAALVAAGAGRRVLVSDGSLRDLARPDEQHVVGDRTGGPVDSLYAAIAAVGRGAGVLMSYGDIVYHPRIVRALLAAGGDIVIAADRGWQGLWSLRFGVDWALDAEGFAWQGDRVTAIGHRIRNADEAGAQFIGLMRLSQAGIDRLDLLRRRGDDCTRLLSRAIEAGIDVRAVGIDGGWCEVDREEDLRAYRRALRRRHWSHDWRWETGDVAVSA